jgi:tetratricopeptide (TPR) repeat protein
MSPELSPDALMAEVARLAASEQLEPMVNLVEQAVPTLTDPALALRLRLRAALACLDGLGDSARASRLLEDALCLDPTSDEALAILGDVYAAQGNWTGLREVRERQLALSASPPEQVALLIQLADLDAGPLQDLARAAERYQRVLELDPHHRRAIEALDSLCMALGAWDRLLVILQLQSELATTPAEAVTALTRMGEVRQLRLGDPAGAAESYRQALARCGEAPALAAQRQALQQTLESLGG